MKKLSYFLLMFGLLFTACEGDPGPPGIPGPPGQDGGVFVANAFEIVLDFTPGNNYSFVEPYGFDVFPTDVTLVYISWEVLNGQDVWRLLPQTEYFNDGELVYNYDFTQEDVQFFLDGTTNFATLPPEYTLEQVFRVVVVPADNVGRLDFNDYEAVVNYYGIEDFPRR
jgi:hypothetical protein